MQWVYLNFFFFFFFFGRKQLLLETGSITAVRMNHEVNFLDPETQTNELKQAKKLYRAAELITFFRLVTAGSPSHNMNRNLIHG